MGFRQVSLRSVCIRNIDTINLIITMRSMEIVTDPMPEKIIGQGTGATKARLGKNVLRGGFDFKCLSLEGTAAKGQKKRTCSSISCMCVDLMDTSAANRGNLCGTAKKISLRDLGVTSVELMPVYEFGRSSRKREGQLPDYVTWKKKAKRKGANAG